MFIAKIICMLSVSNITVYRVFIDCLEIQTTVFGQEDCFLQFFFHSLVIGSVLLSAKTKNKKKKFSLRILLGLKIVLKKVKLHPGTIKAEPCVPCSY